MLFNPFGVVQKPYPLFPELHSGLFMFNPFGIFRVVGNGQSFKTCVKFAAEKIHLSRKYSTLETAEHLGNFKNFLNVATYTYRVILLKPEYTLNR